MFNQSYGSQEMNATPRNCQSNAGKGHGQGQGQGGGCGMNTWPNEMDMNMNTCGPNGCPRPQPLVAPRRVCISNQVTPVPQPVICPIECRRVNRCMYYPVFYPQYEQTFVTIPGNQLGNFNQFNQSY